MSRREALLAGLLGVFLVMGWLLYKIHGYDNQSVAAGVVPHGFTRKDITLKPDEAARVVIRPNRLATVTSAGTKTEYIPEDARVAVSVSTHGVVSVQVQHYGACFAPGVGVAYTSRLSIVFDARLGYYDRLSLLAGLNVRPLIPYVAAGLNVFRRTSLFVGRGNKLWIAGLRVSF